MEEAATGMSGFITALQTNLTSANLWSELTAAGAFIGLMVVFAFGYRVIRKVIKGTAKGKANV